MKNTKLNEHCKKDKVKWVLTFISLLLVFALLAALFVQVFYVSKNTADESSSEINGGMIVEDEQLEKESKVKIAAAPIVLADYPAMGISAGVQSAYTLTATVTPVESDVVDFTWTAAFKNPSSEWATGKDVNSYVTLNPSGLSCAVSCKSAFGEPIDVKITYDFDDSISSTRTFQYIKRVKSVSLSTDFTQSSFDNGDGYNIEINAVFGEGTVEGTFKVNNFYAKMSDSAYTYGCRSAYKERLYGSFNDEAYFQNPEYYFENGNLELSMIDFFEDLDSYEEDLLWALRWDIANNSSDPTFQFISSVTYSYGDYLSSQHTAYSAKINFPTSKEGKYLSVTGVNVSGEDYIF